MSEVTPLRECVRCGAKRFFLDKEHLCADIEKRLARREKQKKAVLNIIREMAYDDQCGEPGFHNDEKAAELIVAKLANLGVEND